MAELIPPTLMGMLGGVVAWFATNFVGNPFAKFYRLRDEIRSSLIFYSNIGEVFAASPPTSHQDWGKYLEAETTFRRLASEIRVLDLNYRWLSCLLSSNGYNLQSASANLIGFSNSMGHHNEMRRGIVANFRDKIERNLKFYPLTYPDGVLVRYD